MTARARSIAWCICPCSSPRLPANNRYFERSWGSWTAISYAPTQFGRSGLRLCGRLVAVLLLPAAVEAPLNGRSSRSLRLLLRPQSTALPLLAVPPLPVSLQSRKPHSGGLGSGLNGALTGPTRAPMGGTLWLKAGLFKSCSPPTICPHTPDSPSLSQHAMRTLFALAAIGEQADK